MPSHPNVAQKSLSRRHRAWLALVSHPWGENQIASTTNNARRSVRPLAPGAPTGQNQEENGPLNGESLVVDFTAAGPLRGPTVAEMQRLVSQGLATQLCLWGEPGALSILRQRLYRILRTEPLRRAVYKIDRVQQPDGKIRFDLFVSAVVATPLQNRIAQGATTHRYGWYIRPHIPYRQRVPAGTPRHQAAVAPAITVPQDAARSQHLRLITYNINGVANKRTELRHFLERTECDVLGLQETLLKATDWHLRFPQYSCFTAMGDLTASTRGVAIVVANKFACSPVGRASPYWVFVRLFGAGLAHPVIVGSIYVPHRAGRNHVLTTLPLEIGRLKQAHPDDPVIVLGDWNLDLDEVQRETTMWPYPAHTLANLGLVPTRRRGGRTIDHISYWGTPAMGGAIPPPRVLTDWDLSDHYPVMARFPGLVDRAHMEQPVVPAGGRPRIWVTRPETRQDIVSANYWAPLAEEFLDAANAPENPIQVLDSLSVRWADTCHAVARDLDLTREGAAKPATVSKSLSRAIRRRRQAFRQWTQKVSEGTQTEAQIEVARVAYEEARRTSRKAIRRHTTKAWHRQILKAHAQMLHRPRDFWQWSSRHGNWRTKGAPAGLQPVYATDGTLLTALPDIVRRWASHYETLGTDVTGHSQVEDYWSHMCPDPLGPELEELNASFTKTEMWQALGVMKRHKAPGKDGVPTDFLQACLQEKPLQDTPMSEALLTLLNMAYTMGTIPASWEESVVISLPKDGDLADCSNYRGISLMPTALKVITVILAARISAAGEDRNLFSYTQAGFRKLEEAVTQAACVIDILQRRRLAKENSYVTFVDFQKAYDVVPHGALFAKLQRFGVRGSCLQFLKGLYARSSISVRLGNGKSAQYSDPFLLRRGLRQG